eukprot:Gregarina_sp_Pseudo_9__3670@NODE_381_length_2990_cov_5_502542_g360_i0_p1_GENE_NODE_381_length_2990_cov_5_502542_g360_i0NODE_381_length_2990_cov_5_502542_g360_i0_p1_ORF_typecomplete_len958_score295_94tRNAsynt_2c/PF01411_19/2_4e194tRNA_SAD/PF07973_14/1_3e04tRNA_SAD/PF07973_14/3_1e12DUF2458/PF10454_9/0_29DUF1018/PF06252_12/0_38DUF3416/PF11896_8/0_87_NODE_381_length_2990_cov_5_502542_g360_i0172890
MKALSSKEARDTFIKYFEAQGHKHWPSSAVVPYNDPTLLFVNAGMCQYKAIFLGDVDKDSEFGRLKRACNTQKCIRAGGKHNDLEDVGKDVYHHTFFEMLGNWSFGDYFKTEAIEFAWELLTKVYEMPPERLYATYFGGDEKQGLEADLTARDLWLQKLPASHVLPGSMKENFWEMGDTGPCGPCSELHFDRIGNRECPELVNADDPDVLEVWNLVFMEFNREASGKLTKLPAGCVDTGMGLERLVSILNNKRSNYDTDLFVPLFSAIQRLCPNCPREYQGKVGAEDPDRIDLAYRAVADHIRTLSIAIADGATPSNEGRGYVLRRVLRRAVRYGRQVLGAPANSIWFAELVDTVVASLGDAFPELRVQEARIKAILADEEKQFSKTLDRGTSRFLKAVKGLKPGDKLEGKVCFDLLATYGFPLDLTEILCEEQQLTVDRAGFEAAMEEHQRASEGGGANRKLLQMLTPDKVALLERDLKVSKTDDSFKYDWNTLGDGPEIAATVKALYNGAAFCECLESASNEVCMMILDRTNFYAEAGGQVGDVGFATVKGGKAEVVISDTKRMGPFVLHMVTVSEGTLAVGDEITLSVDYTRRAAIAKNHTGTHVLNFALRKVLGEGVEQAGSVVEPQRLRFDFSASAGLTVTQVTQVEEQVRGVIERALPVYTHEVALESAKQNIKGLRCMFGENYPSQVRVVSVGAPVSALLEGDMSGFEFPVEFCGGTHLSNSAEIDKFVIVSEESIAKGIRRLVAATGIAADEVLTRGSDLLARFQTAANRGNATDDVSEFNSLRDELLKNKESLPLLTRKQCTELLDAYNARKLEEAKAKQKALKKEGDRIGKELTETAKKSQAKFIVHVAPSLCGDFKAMEEALNVPLKKLNIPVFIVSEESGVLNKALAGVPKGASATAIDWLTKALLVVNGKGGGKEVSARGTFPLTQDLAVAQIEAERLATTLFV